MTYGPAFSDCPAARVHPDDLVPYTSPGWTLTGEESRRVESVLGPVLADQFAEAEEMIRSWLECLHPMPLSAVEREQWGLELPGTNYVSLTMERKRLARMRKAFASKDWTALLYAFTKRPKSKARLIPQGAELQPLREELDARRLTMMKDAARRYGCTCYDDPAATGQEPR